MPLSGKCEEFSDHSQNTCIPSNKQAVVKDRADNVKFELTTLSGVRKKTLAGAFAQNIFCATFAPKRDLILARRDAQHGDKGVNPYRG